MTRLTGYAHPLAARAGNKVDIMVSAEQADEADIALVRLIHGDESDLGPGFIEEEIAIGLPARIAVAHQPVQRGSYAKVADEAGLLADVPAGTLYAFIRPSIVAGLQQNILGCWSEESRKGYCLTIAEDGVLELRLGSTSKPETLRLSVPLVSNCWYFVAATWDVATGISTLAQCSRINSFNSHLDPLAPYDYDDSVAGSVGSDFAPADAPFLIGGSTSSHAHRERVTALYNGKIDRPGLHAAALDEAQLLSISQGGPPPQENLLAYWDTTVGYGDKGIGDTIVDTGPHGLDAIGVNRPVRCSTGWNWEGIVDCYKLAPDQYGGVAFHDDALIDCEWDPTITLDLPTDMRSGVYALRLRAHGVEDHIPFFVSPAKPRARIAVVMSTFTYLAYANLADALSIDMLEAGLTAMPILSPSEIEAFEEERRSEYGKSVYDVHSDGAGVCFSSWLRPIRSLRPKYRASSQGTSWCLPADLSLLWWLEHEGYEYDVITEHDVHRDGADALRPYRAVVSGTHPEYYSRRMLDGFQAYLDGGGRYLSLGGDGYYWVCETRAEDPSCVELRRLETGQRAWQAEPGEAYMVSNGERGGMWRHRGRAPQKWVGLGSTTQCMNHGRPFERMPDSRDPRLDWMFDGIGEESLGDFLNLGKYGASALEMDRYDLALGTPPHTLLVASSFGHTDSYMLVVDEIGASMPGLNGVHDPRVRGDVIFFTTRRGGAVFAAGSMTWIPALPCNGGDNNIARLTGNVLRTMLTEGPIPGFE